MNWTRWMNWIPDQILPKATKYCQVMPGTSVLHAPLDPCDPW